MKPIILVTAGVQDTARGLVQLYCFRNYCEAITQAGGIPLIVGDDQDAEQLADMADGLCVSGGPDVAAEAYGGDPALQKRVDPWRDGVELPLIKAFIARKKPIFGICRGLQYLNIVLGGNLYEDIPARLGLEHIYGSTHSCKADPDSILGQLFGESFTVNSYHHQSLDRLGDGLKVIARTEEGIVEAAVHETLPITAVQWHPERMTGAVRFDPEGPDMKPLYEYFINQCR